MTDEPRENLEELNSIADDDEVDESDISTPEAACLPENHSSADEKESIPQSVEILNELAQIRDMMEKRLSRDKTKEEAFERLYQELDALKRNKAFEDYRSLFIDLVLLYDRIQLAKVDLEAPLSDILESLQEELKEILSRREIEPIIGAPAFFDPAFQRAVSTEIVEIAQLDGKVIRVLRGGFTYKGTVLRPEEVVVGRYQPSQPNRESGEETSCEDEETE